MNGIRKLNAEEIDLRVGRVIKTAKFSGVTLLLYKNARVDMMILDELYSPLGWSRKHEVVNGNMYCTVSVYNKDRGQWVSKQDCGTESNTEGEKGEASDSFKRACVNWGIGRELYTAPEIVIPCELDEKGKVKSGVSWYVGEIGYTDAGDISRLAIFQRERKQPEKLVFKWVNGETARTNPEPVQEPKQEPQQQSEPKKSEQSAAEEKTFLKNYKCSVCGKPVHDKLGLITARKYGAWLCSPDCVDKFTDGGENPF